MPHGVTCQSEDKQIEEWKRKRRLCVPDNREHQYWNSCTLDV